MVEIDKINIWNHSTSDSDELLYATKSDDGIKIFHYPTKNEITILSSEISALAYFKKAENVFLVDWQNNTSEIINTNGESTFKNGRLSKIGNNYIVLNEENQSTIFDNNFQLIQTIHKTPNHYQLNFKDNVIFYLTDSSGKGQITNSRSKLFKYSLTTDLFEEFVDATKYSWTEETERKSGFICQLIGQYDEGLICQISKYRLVCFDIRTKSVIWELNDFVSNKELYKYLAFGESTTARTPMNWHLSESDGFAHLLSRHFYWRLNLRTQKVELLADYTEQSPLERWNFTKTTLFNNKIIFVGSKGFSSTPNYLGVFDLIMHQVIWEQKIENGSIMGEPNVFGEEYVTIVDSNKNMYIFKLN